MKRWLFGDDHCELLHVRERSGLPCDWDGVRAWRCAVLLNVALAGAAPCQ